MQILALGRQNKMTGAAEQYQYILRDESMHCNFGIDLINTIKMENPELWTDSFKAELAGLFQRAIELEYAYAEDTMQRGVLGLNAAQFKEYLRFIANRRMQQIGLDELFPGISNPFPCAEELHTIITNPVIHDKSTNIDIGKPTQTSSDRDVRYGDGSKTMQRQMSLDLGMSYPDTEQVINYLPIKDPARKNWITGSVNMQGYLEVQFFTGIVF